MRRLPIVCLLTVATALPARAADEDKWSTVKGKVVFDDSKQKIPARVFPPAAKGANLPPCAAADKDFLTDEWMVDPTTKGVKDVFVWLALEPTADEWTRLKDKGPKRLRDFPPIKPADWHPDLKAPEKATVELDQPCCRFIPHVLAVRVGQTLVIKNSAAFAHNANYTTQNNGADNPLLPAGGKVQVPIKKPERFPIKVNCNIHGWMSASIRVFDHPYFAITSATGEYEIQKAPVGKYRIFVWHPEGGYAGKNDGRWGYELTITPKMTEVKTYSVTLDDKTAK